MSYSSKIIELIKLFYFYPEGLEVFVETSAKQSASFGGKTFDEKQKEHLRQTLVSDDFLKPFTEAFAKIFKEEEISRLIKLYQSDEIKKLLANGAALLFPLTLAVQAQVERLQHSE